MYRLEEIEYNGSLYYKDNTGNVYDYKSIEEKEELLVVGTLTAQGIEFSDSNTAVSVDVVNDLEENKQELSIIEAQLLEKQTDAEQLTERLRVSREDCERAKLALDEAKVLREKDVGKCKHSGSHRFSEGLS